ncbi:hypothetical protein K8I28_16980 [bacterium]|nr:hypothetical protein [bacterium]
MSKLSLQRERNGTMLINTVFIVILLVALGFMLMNWAYSESVQKQRMLASAQASYVADYAIYHELLPQLRKIRGDESPPAVFYGRSGEYKFQGESIGNYTDVVGYRKGDSRTSVNYGKLFSYELQATGIVKLPTTNSRVRSPEVRKKVQIIAQFRHFAHYMYLTDQEITDFNEVIWFWQHDTLWGRVHSNDEIGIKHRPMFYGDVSSCADDFIQGAGYNPWFSRDPQFNVLRVEFPYTDEPLRNAAIEQGHWITDGEGTLNTLFIAKEEWLEFYQWQRGTPYPSNGTPDDYDDDGPFAAVGMVEYGDQVGVFVEGDAEIFGESFQGNMTIGTSGNLRLIDNLLYHGYYPNFNALRDTIPSNFPHRLGLVSEQTIFVADTKKNGRGNGDQHYPDQDSCSIIICAAMLALNGSFTIEHQNDVGDPYRWCDNPQNNQDERGNIHIRGSIAQRRRGYVHRSNCGGTGYGKDYDYDFRFRTQAPPFMGNPVDEDGHLLIDVVFRHEVE